MVAPLNTVDQINPAKTEAVRPEEYNKKPPNQETTIESKLAELIVVGIQEGEDPEKVMRVVANNKKPSNFKSEGKPDSTEPTHKNRFENVKPSISDKIQKQVVSRQMRAAEFQNKGKPEK
jgi:hypothetical protein